MGYIGWVGNAMLVVGLIGIGRRWRPAFLFQAAGELLWVAKAAWLGAPDMVAICVVFAALAATNYVQWARS